MNERLIEVNQRPWKVLQTQLKEPKRLLGVILKPLGVILLPLRVTLGPQDVIRRSQGVISSHSRGIEMGFLLKYENFCHFLCLKCHNRCSHSSILKNYASFVNYLKFSSGWFKSHLSMMSRLEMAIK